MARASTIDKLPEEIRLEIGRLKQNGRSIDEIIAHLRQLDGIAPVSRSALGRHLKGMEKIGERLRRSRQLTEAVARELGGAPESQSARVAIELLHTVVLDLFTNAEEGEEVNADGLAALAGNPEGVMMLAKALDHLGRASKTNIEARGRSGEDRGGEERGRRWERTRDER
jgi:hypothetical protein